MNRKHLKFNVLLLLICIGGLFYFANLYDTSKGHDALIHCGLYVCGLLGILSLMGTIIGVID